MTCPKCGFVSFSGLPQCKKCGYRFASASSRGHSAVIAEPGAPHNHASLDAVSSDNHEISPPGRHLKKSWQDQSAARLDLEGSQGRQGRFRGQAAASDNLNLDFGASEPVSNTASAERQDFSRSNIPSESVPSAEEEQIATPDLSWESEELGQFSSPTAAPEALQPPASPEERPVEIILEDHSSPSEEELVSGGLENGETVAPLGKRFLAAVLDAVVLTVSGGLFALIFWRAGGQLVKTPLDIAVLGFITSFFIFVYFTAFTAFAAATPGLAAMGLEVRAVDGGPPSLRDSFWRGVGYLVSLFPLMLGFVWALVDSDGLTWHDRMSETFIAQLENASVPDTKVFRDNA